MKTAGGNPFRVRVPGPPLSHHWRHGEASSNSVTRTLQLAMAIAPNTYRYMRAGRFQPRAPESSDWKIHLAGGDIRQIKAVYREATDSTRLDAAQRYPGSRTGYRLLESSK